MLEWKWGKPLISSYTSKPQKGYIEIEPNAGTPFRRMTFSDISNIVTCSFTLTREQYPEFYAWYVFDLRQGTLPFTIFDCRYGIKRTARLIGDVPEIQTNSNRYTLSLTMAFEPSVLNQSRFLIADSNLILCVQAESTPPTYTQGTFNSFEPQCLAYSGNLFVSLSRYQNANKIAISTDFSNWEIKTDSNLSGASEWVDVIYDGTRFVAISSDGKIAVSTNGISWQVQNTILGSNSWYKICHSGAKYIVLGYSGYISTSTDALTWITPTQNANLSQQSSWFGGLIYDGEKFIAVNGTGYISTSQDGTTWTTPTQNANLASQTYWRSMAHGGGMIFALNTYGYYSTSQDGENWSVPSAITQLNNEQSGTVYGQNKFYSLTSGGVLIEYEPAGQAPLNVNKELVL